MGRSGDEALCLAIFAVRPLDLVLALSSSAEKTLVVHALNQIEYEHAPVEQGNYTTCNYERVRASQELQDNSETHRVIIGPERHRM